MKTAILLTSVALIGFAGAAYAADSESYNSSTKIEKDSKGNYSEKDKASNTDTTGTTTSDEKTVKVDADANDTEKTVTTEHTKDPKGLFNKQTTKTKDTVKTASDGSMKKTHKKTVNGRTTENTTEQSPAAGQ